MDPKFKKPYNPNDNEDNIYNKWEESGVFNPDVCIDKDVCNADAPTFSMVLPPPNVTGELHLGSSLMVTIEDIITRYERMLGKRTLWLPGTDHAAIATQTKVEKKVKEEEGVDKHDLGREELMRRAQDFADKNRKQIKTQLKKIGGSLDWSREAFTLDETRARAVRTAFLNMYESGLIYRGNRIVNWDPKGQTTISDDEVVHVERTATLYTFYYSPDFPIPIATTRPETKVGDTAVAVNPGDERYKDYIGKEFDVDFVGTKLHIKVIGDEQIDPEFGTGALGVTPAHSKIDWDLAQKHNLDVLQVINENAEMDVGDPEVRGKTVDEARENIVEKLKEKELLKEEKEITQNIATAERSGGTVEPLPKQQWFVAVNKKFKLPYSEIEGIESGQEVTLKELMSHVVDKGQISILPERFEKTYFHWIENLGDWCISRQIWYGHQIPVWYCVNESCGERVVSSEEQVSECPTCGGQVEQDPDTLDTWFSSALWTFSTLGWPEKTNDLETYHPTTLLETGYDILFFWVARMILMSTFHMGQIPFKTVYLHGIVRNEEGQKMSKSLDNAGDPLQVIEEYGTDALRMALIAGNSPGHDVKVGPEKFKAYKHFANKLWNVTRFILTNTDNLDISSVSESDFTKEDTELLEELNEVLKDISKDMEKYNFYLAAEKLYQYIWARFADEIIEASKQKLYGEEMDDETKRSAQLTLYTILTTCLKMLHPIMPFITEEIWSHLEELNGENPVIDDAYKQRELLMIEKWPTSKE